MNIMGFRGLVSLGFNAPLFIVGAMSKYGYRAFGILKEYFGRDKHLNLFIEQKGRGRWIEDLKIQDAMLQGEFCEKRFGEWAVLYTEYVLLEWYLEINLGEDLSGSFEYFSGKGESREKVNFNYLEEIEDIRFRSLCRMARSVMTTTLLSVSSLRISGIYADIGWSSGFFGTKGEREFIRDFELLTK